MLICFNVLFSQLSKSYKGMAAVITLVILTRLQIFLNPYKLKVNNEVENFSNVAVGFTLYGGLLFIKGQSEVSFIEALTFMLIITINSVYILFWIYLMAKTYDKHEAAKRIVSLLKIVLFRGDNDTVFSGPSDGTCNQVDEQKEELPIPKKHIKGVKNKTKKSIKFNPLNDESIACLSKRNIKSNRFRENMTRNPKLKKRREKETFEHNQFWVKIDKEFDEFKRESFGIVNIARDSNSSYPKVKEEDKENEENKSSPTSSQNSSKKSST